MTNHPTTYVLTGAETEIYDGADDAARVGLWASLHDRYGDEANRLGAGVTEIRHPTGFTVAHLASSPPSNNHPRRATGFAAGDRVETKAIGEDHDTGYVVTTDRSAAPEWAADGQHVEVGWDSGVTT